MRRSLSAVLLLCLAGHPSIVADEGAAPATPSKERQELNVLINRLDAKKRRGMSLAEKQLYIAALLEAGQYRKGVIAYEEMWPDKEENPVMMLAYYKLLKGGGENGKAVDIFWKLREKRYPRVLYETGLRFCEVGEFEDTGRYFFEKANEIDPFFALPYAELAKRSNDPDEVIKNAAKALALLYPEDRLASEMRAILLKANKK